MKKAEIPTSLSALGIKHEVQPMMIEDAVQSLSWRAIPKKFDRDKVTELLKSVR